MEPDEITGNVYGNEEQQLAIDNSEVIDVKLDKKLQGIKEKLNLYSSLWAASKKEYDQHSREAKPDCTVKPITGNVDGNEEQQLTMDNSEVIDVKHDKKLQGIKEKLNLYSSLWAASKKEYDQHSREATPDCTVKPISGNLNEDEEHQLTRDNSVAVDIASGKEIQKADENPNSLDWWAASNREYNDLYETAYFKLKYFSKLNKDEPKSVDGRAAANRKDNQVTVSSFMCDIPKAFLAAYPQSDPNIDFDDSKEYLDSSLEKEEEVVNEGKNVPTGQVTASSLEDKISEAFLAAYPQSDSDIDFDSIKEYSDSPREKVMYEVKNGPTGCSLQPVIIPLNLLEASDICKAAYKQVLFKALVVGLVGIELCPALDSLEELKQIIACPSSRGMRVEFSIETAIFPIRPNDLASMMMDVDTWAILLPELIYRASCIDLTAGFKQLTASDENGNIVAVKMVTAEVRLPTYLVETRKFHFLRFQREIVKDTWAIFDVSQQCFPNSPDGVIPKRMCRKRPSGVIIMAHENNSKVVWTEDVEVYELALENNIYSALLNSNSAYSAKHWVSTFSHKMHREKNCKIWAIEGLKVKEKGMVYLRVLCDYMKTVFAQCVHEHPDEGRLTILSDEQGMRILRDATGNYIGVTSFRVKSKPISVLDYVSKKDMDLEWSTIPHKEVIRQVTKEPYNMITLWTEYIQKNSKNILQEVSRDHFCSYVVSAPLTKMDVYDLLTLGQRIYIPIYPTCFAIMPDGSGGLHSDASLVTFVVYRQFDSEEAHCAIDTMIDLVTTTMGDVEKYADVDTIIDLVVTRRDM